MLMLPSTLFGWLGGGLHYHIVILCCDLVSCIVKGISQLRKGAEKGSALSGRRWRGTTAERRKAAEAGDGHRLRRMVRRLLLYDH